ncbi:hypothetical protein FRC07_000489, partial [Ceratobasidium sp. 392]
MSSDCSTPDSSQRPGGRSHDSNTTPSPSAGYRSSPPDPQTLSSKLALYDASRALSIAAETLAAAAQAMSKAAASLATVSGGFATSDTQDEKLVRPKYSADLESPGSWYEWQQSSYVLSTKNKATNDTPNRLPDEHVPINPTVSNITETNQISISDSGNHVHLSVEEIPPASTEIVPECIMDSSNAEFDGITNKINLDYIPNACDTIDTAKPVSNSEAVASPEPAFKVSEIRANANETCRDIERTEGQANVNGEPSKSSAADNSRNRSCIVLDKAFDELPAAAFLCQRHPKTICFWKYWDASASVVNVLKFIVSRPVVHTSSPKKKQMDRIFNIFLQSESCAVLLWPSDAPLPENANLISNHDIRAVHIGELSVPNKHVDFSRAFLVTSRQSIRNTPDLLESMKAYPIDAVNGTCNEQGPDSALHSVRAILRKRFAKKSSAQYYYL